MALSWYRSAREAIERHHEQLLRLGRIRSEPVETTTRMTREEVYKLIDGERDHQDNLPSGRSDGRPKDVGSYLTLIREYSRKADAAYTDVCGHHKALDVVRKIAALAVRCMEEHGAPARAVSGVISALGRTPFGMDRVVEELIVLTDLREQFMLEACKLALNSEDPSTQNGAVLVAPGDQVVIGRGWSRFPTGIASTPERWNDRDTKLGLVIHAEEMAIIDACKGGHAALVRGGTLYCPWAACRECAKKIIEHGVAALVIHKDCELAADEHWRDEREAGLAMLREAGVRIRSVRLPAGSDCPPIRRARQPWQPSVAGPPQWRAWEPAS